MPPSPSDQTDDYRSLFLNDVPLLDVRAPVEFAQGAFPCAENHPLMNDAERERVGIHYTEHGPDEAAELGHALVSGEQRQRRIAAWQEFLQRHPDALIYCFRGGMRSKISQRWLFEATGLRRPRVEGGYKALRRYLIDQLEANAEACWPIVIGGQTGVGKTRLLHDCDAMIDLEGLARHRGSAFGGHPGGQPTQIDFENALSIRLLKQVAGGNRPFAIEDESRNIGSRHVPPTLFARLERAPLVLLEATLDERVAITLQEYVHDALAEFDIAYGIEAGFDRWAAWLRDSMQRIRRRLGGDRHEHAIRLFDAALVQHRENGLVDDHRNWIRYLLLEYYDSMYDYQLRGKRPRIVFHGSRIEIEEFLRVEYGVCCTI